MVSRRNGQNNFCYAASGDKNVTEVHDDLPVADPLESKEFHSGAGAEFVGTVVLDLDDVAGFVAAEELGLGFGEVLHEEIGVLLIAWVTTAAFFCRFDDGFLCHL